jgi:MarR family transcriptional repressor of emrRAB
MAGARNARLHNLLGAAALGVTDAMRDAATAASDLDEAAATALVALLDFSPAGTVQRLSTALGLTHSGAVRLVDRLAASGHVVRRRGADSRSLTVSLTAKGRRRALSIRAARATALEAVTEGMSPDAKVALTDALEHVVANLTRQRLALRAAGEAPTGGALCRLCDFSACGRPEGKCPAQLSASSRSGRAANR